MSSRHLLLSASSLTSFAPFSLLGYDFTVDEAVEGAAAGANADTGQRGVQASAARLWVSAPATEAPALIRPSLNAQGEPTETSSQLDDVLLLLSLAHGQDIVRGQDFIHSQDFMRGQDFIHSQIHGQDIVRGQDAEQAAWQAGNTERHVNNVGGSFTGLYHYRFGTLFRVLLAPTLSPERHEDNRHKANHYDYHALEHCYGRMQDPQWQRQYAQGACLRVAQSLARQTSLSSALSHAWWLLEHLFALNNHHWLSPHHIRTLAPLEKLLYLLRRYLLSTSDPLPEADRQRCQRYVQALNQLTTRAQVSPALSQSALGVVYVAQYCLLALVGFGVLSAVEPRFASLRQFEEACQQPEQLRSQVLHAVMPE